MNDADTPGCVRACVLSGVVAALSSVQSAELSGATPCYLILALSLLGRKARLFPTLGEHVVPGMNRDPEAPPLEMIRHLSLSLSLSLCLTVSTKIKASFRRLSVFLEVMVSRHPACVWQLSSPGGRLCSGLPSGPASASRRQTSAAAHGSDSNYSGFFLCHRTEKNVLFIDAQQ